METSDIVYFVARWLHYFFGVIWIGMLYYFNFVQMAFFAETDAATKSAAIQKLVPRALKWFRYGALFTFLTGLIMLLIWGARVGGDAMQTSFGMFILLGSTIGTIMFLNVWLIIWPAQKVVIESAVNVAAGRPANPQAAARGAAALLASRSNTMFSLPMLFFMGAASHLPFPSDTANYTNALLGALVVVALLEINAIKGKLGPLTSIVGVIHSGIALTVVLFGVLWMLV
jgi:uncharacterized membrane protein